MFYFEIKYTNATVEFRQSLIPSYVYKKSPDNWRFEFTSFIAVENNDVEKILKYEKLAHLSI